MPHPVGAVFAAPAGTVAHIGICRWLMMVRSKAGSTVHAALRGIIITVGRPARYRCAFVGECALGETEQAGKTTWHNATGGVALHIPDARDSLGTRAVVLRTNAKQCADIAVVIDKTEVAVTANRAL